jgi:pSer/pThr/pTyr-binding forkhead associated (FHA) protein
VEFPWDREVSGLHAELERVGEDWVLLDDGLSRNGTYLNGERVAGRARLRDGDLVRAGRTIVLYRRPLAGEGELTIDSDMEVPFRAPELETSPPEGEATNG